MDDEHGLATAMPAERAAAIQRAAIFIGSTPIDAGLAKCRLVDLLLPTGEGLGALDRLGACEYSSVRPYSVARSVNRLAKAVSSNSMSSELTSPRSSTVARSDPMMCRAAGSSAMNATRSSMCLFRLLCERSRVWR
ncbi:hypothetical protein GS928_23660 [Rhodococcus hoagii]|nr:hypothetical protein [Prescottella equi]